MRTSKKHRTSSLQTAHALLICGLAFLATSALLAESPGEETETVAPARAGLRAYLDPETGELTSTPSREQVEALSEDVRSHALEKALSRSSAGLEPFALERGGRGIFLEGRFQSALVVRRRDDGGFQLVCADDAEHAGEALTEPPPAASPQWVEK